MIIAILNQKGGVGKSTLTVNLARYFTLQRRSVALIDCDDQGSASLWHEKANGELLHVYCLSKATFEKDIQNIVPYYDYIFIDGVPRISHLTTMAIKISDIVLIPVQPSPYDIWSTEDIVKLIQDRQIMTPNKPRAFFVMSRIIANTNLGYNLADILSEMGLPSFLSHTFSRVAFSESLENGLTVLDGKFEGSKACQEIKNIAQELQGVIDGINLSAAS